MTHLLTSYDSVLIIAAAVIMAAGLFFRGRALSEKTQRPRIAMDPVRLTGYLLRQRKIRERTAVGASHLALFWGIVIPVAVIVLAQFGGTVPAVPARILSLCQEAAGVLMLAGVLYFLIRRIRLAETDGPKQTLFPMILLLVIPVSGFLAEGARLAITGTPAAWSSPLGSLLSFATPPAPLFMQVMIRLHFFSVLLFIAAIPYTFMRHLVTVPLNILYPKDRPSAALRKLVPETGDIGANTARDFSWKQRLEADACVSCGRCEENCPAFISGKSLSPRKVMAGILAQLRTGSGTPLLEDAVTGDEVWSCTTCMACATHCPVYAEAMDKIVDMRRYRVLGKGDLPPEARPVIRNLELFGDVQGYGVSRRMDWARGLDIPMAGDGRETDVLLWVGCSGAFHPRNRQTAQALVKILKAAEVTFSILGKAESCCGDPARRLGEEDLYRRLAERNIRQFRQAGVKEIVTLCPHCLNTLKNEYPDLGCEIRVTHATRFVADLVRDKRITPVYPAHKTMAVHDACYLGRYNQVFQSPRELLCAVPGTRLAELPRNGESGFCCGGGGGRMWLHENQGENICRVRALEIAETGPDIVGTACPFCLVMLDDGIKSLEGSPQPRVADIIDIVADAIP